jgi:hypothetical protein
MWCERERQREKESERERERERGEDEIKFLIFCATVSFHLLEAYLKGI